jgi:hypothetical protein
LRPPQNSKAWLLGFKSSRFLKKAAQKLLHCRRRAFESPEAQIKKVFLLLFLQKKKSFLYVTNIP